MRVWISLACAGAVALFSAACAGQNLAQQAGRADALSSVERGHAMAQQRCASCHAVGREGPSPLAEARPFRTLTALYPVDSLAEAFAEGITVGHPEMPAFRLEPDEIQDLLNYLQSIQEGPTRAPS